MSHISKAGIEYMLEALNKGIAVGTKSAILVPDQAKMLLESYLLLASVREHDGAAGILGSIESAMLECEPASHEQKGWLMLYELLAGEPWSPAASENLCRERKAAPLRVVTT